MLQMSKSAKVGLLAIVGFVVAFIYLPLFVVIINSFNAAQIASWPIQNFSTYWWEFAVNYEPIRLALLNSVIVAFWAMVIASLLGTLVSFALNRYEFFGKSTVNLLVVLSHCPPRCGDGCGLLQHLLQLPQPHRHQCRLFRPHCLPRNVLHCDGVQQCLRQAQAHEPQLARSIYGLG